MKIAISFGAFLPVPPLRGGATEKIWTAYATRLAARGHEVIAYSRQWPGLPDDAMLDGVRHVRLPGHDHYPRLWQNLLLDLRWSLRVRRALPKDALVISHNIALPWLLTTPPRRHAAPVAVTLGRMPKGQLRFYRRVSRIYAFSEAVRSVAHAQYPAVSPLIRVIPNAIDVASFAQPRRTHDPAAAVTIGYIGRLHPEKGLGLLAAAIRTIAQIPDLPAWRLMLIGPSDVAAGGGGAAWLHDLRRMLPDSSPRGVIEILPPIWNSAQLAEQYRQIDVFCYPSLSEQGETFGVSALEAMAAGAVPVVSNLDCFRDFARNGENAFVFNRSSANPAAALAEKITRLLRDSALRVKLANQAQATARRFDYEVVVPELETDLAALL